MLRLSKLTDYGTVVLAHMARKPAAVYAAADVAAATRVALPTVSKLLKCFARAGLVTSYRGAPWWLHSRPPSRAYYRGADH